MREPESPSDITLHWLRQALRWERPGCEPVSAEVEPDAGESSLLGKIARVRLAYAAPGSGPSSLIVKFQLRPSDWEARIYRLLSEEPSLSAPRLYGAFDGGLLVMEDLSPARALSQTQGCTIEQAEDVVLVLAEIHGRFWGDPRVPAIEPARFASVIRLNMEQCWGTFEAKYRAILGGTAAEFEWMWRNAAAVSAHRLSEPATLFHGDVHSENLLFRARGTGRPVLLDWQLAARGLAANDLSFFLVKSLPSEVRRGHEQRLLRRYHESLPERVRAGYSFDRLEVDYRASVTRSMLSAVMLVGLRFAHRPDRDELADALADRVVSAVRDLRPAQALREVMPL